MTTPACAPRLRDSGRCRVWCQRLGKRIHNTNRSRTAFVCQMSLHTNSDLQGKCRARTGTRHTPSPSTRSTTMRRKPPVHPILPVIPSSPQSLTPRHPRLSLPLTTGHPLSARRLSRWRRLLLTTSERTAGRESRPGAPTGGPASSPGTTSCWSCADDCLSSRSFSSSSFSCDGPSISPLDLISKSDAPTAQNRVRFHLLSSVLRFAGRSACTQAA